LGIIIYALFINVFSTRFYLEFITVSGFKLFKHLKTSFQNNFYFNEFYNYLAAAHFYFYYRRVFLIIDKGVLELFGPSGLFFIYRNVVYFISWFYYQNIFIHFLFIYHSLLAYFFY